MRYEIQRYITKHASSKQFHNGIALYFASGVVSLIGGISVFLQKCFNMDGRSLFFVISDVIVCLLTFASMALICYGLYSVHIYHSEGKKMTNNSFGIILIGHIAPLIVALIVCILFVIERCINDTTIDLELWELTLGFIIIILLIFIPIALIDILIIRKALNHAIAFENGDYYKPIGRFIKPLVFLYIISDLYTLSGYFSNFNGFETLCSIIASILSLCANIMFASLLFAYTSDLKVKRSNKK